MLRQKKFHEKEYMLDTLASLMANTFLENQNCAKEIHRVIENANSELINKKYHGIWCSYRETQHYITEIEGLDLVWQQIRNRIILLFDL